MKDKISFPFKKKVYMGDEYIKKVLKENKLMQENQKLKDINKQLMKEIQWENRLNSKLSKELSDLKEKFQEYCGAIRTIILTKMEMM